MFNVLIAIHEMQKNKYTQIILKEFYNKNICHLVELAWQKIYSTHFINHCLAELHKTRATKLANDKDCSCQNKKPQ